MNEAKNMIGLVGPLKDRLHPQGLNAGILILPVLIRHPLLGRVAPALKIKR